MFDIGFGELVLIFVIGLVVLGPERLPVAVKTVAGWIRALRSLATTVQGELSKELKLQEFQDSLNKVEKASLSNLTPELKASMDELRDAAESMKRSFSQNDPEKASDEANIQHPHADVSQADAVPVTANESLTDLPQALVAAEPVVTSESHTAVESSQLVSSGSTQTTQPEPASLKPGDKI